MSIPWSTLQGSQYRIRDNGVFDLRVAATYSSGATVMSLPTTLTVLNTAPTATLSASGPVDEGGTATMTFGGVIEPSGIDLGARLRFSVDFNNDGDYDDAGDVRNVIRLAGDAQFAVPSAMLADGGTFTIRGRVADKDGGFTEMFTTLVVNEVTPTLSLVERRRWTRARRTGSICPRRIPVRM